MPTIFHPILILPTSTTDVLPWYLMVKKALISAHENSKNEVNELIKKNEQFLDESTDVLPWYLIVACGLESHKLIPISSNTSFAEVDSFIFCFLLSSNEPKEQITILKNGQKYTLEKIK
jgi:hypothetical protein